MIGCLATVVLWWPPIGHMTSEAVWMHECSPWPATECVVLGPHDLSYPRLRTDVVCAMEARPSVHHTTITRGIEV